MTKEELAALIKEQLQEFENNGIKAEEMNKAIKDAIDARLEGGVTKEQLNELNEELEKQGLIVAKMKSNVNKDVKHKTIKSAIHEQFKQEGLVGKLKSIASAGAGMYELTKAVADITTGSVTTDTGGNALLDMLNADEINSLRLRDQFIENYCTVSRTSKAVYTYVDYIPKEGDVDFVGEGVSKPQLDLQAVVRTITPNKAAGHSILTEEAIDDVPRMQSEASGNVFKRYILRRQNGILFGDGTGANPTGITVSAPAFSAATWTGLKKATPNTYDAIVAAKNQIELAANYSDDVDYYPNVAFINPGDYNAMLVYQSDANYIFNNQNGQNVINVDGVSVIAKKEIPSGKILIGDFTKLEVINYIDYNVKIGYINAQLIENKMTMVGEGRFYVLVRELDKKAFLYDDIATIITGITAV